MKWDELRAEYLVFKSDDKKHMLGQFLNEYIYYFNKEEKERFKVVDDVYPLTIKLLNAKTAEERNDLKSKIESSLTYCTYRSLCRKYEEKEND